MEGKQKGHRKVSYSIFVRVRAHLRETIGDT